VGDQAAASFPRGGPGGPRSRRQGPERQGHVRLAEERTASDTIQGRLRFDRTNNYGDDLMRVKQVQNGHWVTVWPKGMGRPGAKLITE